MVVLLHFSYIGDLITKRSGLGVFIAQPASLRSDTHSVALAEEELCCNKWNTDNPSSCRGHFIHPICEEILLKFGFETPQSERWWEKYEKSRWQPGCLARDWCADCWSRAVEYSLTGICRNLSRISWNMLTWCISEGLRCQFRLLLLWYPLSLQLSNSVVLLLR